MRKINSFTLLEVTVSMALISILVSIITFTLNRFNEQIKISSEILSEQNDFYLIRSNLWRDLYDSDSILLNKKNEIVLYSEGESICYYKDQELLHRKTAVSDEQLSVKIESIEKTNVQNGDCFQFNFNWKDEYLVLKYTQFNKNEIEINKYFNSINLNSN